MSETKVSNELAPTDARFTDALGREWHMRITVADLPALRAMGLKPTPIGEAVAWIERTAESEQEELVSAGYLLCRAEAADFSPAEYASGFDGPAMWRLTAALAHAVIDFFPNPTVAAELRSALNEKLNPTPNPSTPSASAGNLRESSG
jgi:hypothetical protein